MSQLMLFFAFVVVATLTARVMQQLVQRTASSWTSAMRWGMAASLIFFGTDHLMTPERYLPMMPDFVPFHRGIVLFTGLCEILGALGLLMPRTRWLAGVMLAVYFVCVFPANIKNAIDGGPVPGLPTASCYYWVRLMFQPVAIWWALHSAEVIGAGITGNRVTKTVAGA